MNLTFAGYKKREGLNLVHRHFSKPFVACLLSPLSQSKLIRKRGDRRGKKKVFQKFFSLTACISAATERKNEDGEEEGIKEKKQIGSIANH